MAANVSDEEVEYVDHPNVVEDDLIYDINDYIRENDVDDDVDMNEPFTNINSEPYHDTNVELDEEKLDEWSLIVLKSRGMHLYLLYDIYMCLFCIIYSMLHVLYYVKLGMEELRVMWAGGHN